MTLHLSHLGPYAIHSLNGMSSTQLLQMKRSLEEPISPTKTLLSGRAKPIFFQLDGIGPVVLKTYLRGGLPGKIISRTYVRVGKPRSRVEMERLLLAGNLGVNVPEPVCWVTKGALFYQTWLILKEIAGVEPLSLLAQRDEKAALKFMDEVRRQILILIENNIHHIDLHPGNVLVRENGEVFIIDFDKARRVSLNNHALLRCYEKRWGRAVRKYGLPESLCHVMV